MASGPRAGRDLAGAAGLAVLAALYLVANRRYPLDSRAAPGPGVFPMVGAGLRLLDHDAAPLVLGLVLGPLMERSLVQALTIGHGEVSTLWSSPLAGSMLLATMMAAVAPVVGHIIARGRAPGRGLRS